MIFKFNARGNRGLKESRFGLVLDHEPPGLVVRKIGSQTAKKIAPLFLIGWNFGQTPAVHRQSGQLHKKHMPSRRLMRPNGGKAIDLVAGQCGKNAGQGERAVRRCADERVCEQIVDEISHDFSLTSPLRP